MSAIFNSFVTTTNNGVRVFYYEADRSDILIDDINSSTASSWASNSKYGINGTFFNYNSTDMVGFAINNSNIINNGVRNYEDTDWAGNYYRPFSGLFSLINVLPSTNTFLFVGVCKGSFPFIHGGDQVTQSNISWGIGGINLYINSSSINSIDTLITQIKTDVDSVTPSSWRRVDGYDVNLRSNIARTAIGYKAPGKVVLATVVNKNNFNDRSNGATAYEVRQIMKNELNCTMGVMLDSGSSTQMSYKKDGVNTYLQVSGACYTRIRLKDTTSITSWNWSANK